MVIKDSGLRKDRHVVWECKCDCGEKTLTSSSNLIRGHTQSCGCLNKERVVETNKTIHPNYTVDYPRLWKQWDDMIRRCENPKTTRYHRYGGRGISVCNEWHDFKTAWTRPTHTETHICKLSVRPGYGSQIHI